MYAVLGTNGFLWKGMYMWKRRFGRGFEQLEGRGLFAGCEFHALDVDGDHFIAPIDALLVINALNDQDSSEVGIDEPRDVNRDGFIAPIDALYVINFLNDDGPGAIEGDCTGSLFVTKDSLPLSPRFLLGGTLEQPILRVRLRAAGEALDVYQLFVSLEGDNVRSIDGLELFQDASSTPFAVATIANVGSDPVPGGYTTFAASMHERQLLISDGREVIIVIRLRVRSDFNGMVSGEAIRPTIVTDGGFQPVLARGLYTRNNLGSNDGDTLDEGEVFVGTDVAAPNKAILGGGNYAVGSKFVSVQDANPDSDGSAVPTGVAPFVQFSYLAALNANFHDGPNKAVLDSLTYVIDATNVSVDASRFVLYNKADSSVKVVGHAYDMSGASITGPSTGMMVVKVDGLSLSDVDAIFESGEAATLVLEAAVLNARISNTLSSVLQGSIDLMTIEWLDRDFGHETRFKGVAPIFVSSTYYTS